MQGALPSLLVTDIVESTRPQAEHETDGRRASKPRSFKGRRGPGCLLCHTLRHRKFDCCTRRCSAAIAAAISATSTSMRQRPAELVGVRKAVNQEPVNGSASGVGDRSSENVEADIAQMRRDRPEQPHTITGLMGAPNSCVPLGPAPDPSGSTPLAPAALRTAHRGSDRRPDSIGAA